MSELLKAAIRGANTEFAEELKGLRQARVPSKMKREMRRKYAKRDKRSK